MLFFSIFFIGIYANSQTKIINKGEIVLPKAFGKHPIYKLKIDGQSNKLEIYLNGVRIYKDLSATTSNITIPINDYIINGKNEIKVKLIADKGMHYQFQKNAFFKLSMIVSGEKKDIVISTLKYTERFKNKLEGTSQEGSYQMDDVLKLTSEGELKISKPKVTNFNMFRLQKVTGVKIQQDIFLPAPFPRWKFLDSKGILDKPFDSLTMEEYMKLKESQKIKGLYDAYRKVYTALKNKDVDEALKLFKERFEEYDIAWYHPKGYTKEQMKVDFDEIVKNSDWELLPFNPKKYFIISDNNKLAEINLISFKKKNKSLYSNYHMKFRWDGKDWILTR